MVNNSTMDDFLDEDEESINPLLEMIEEEKLDQDYDPPFSEPQEQKNRLPIDHPATDTEIDSHELYDEGLAGAAEVDLPDPEDAIGVYDPAEDKSQKKK